MKSVTEGLSAIPARALGTVLHIGAGAAAALHDHLERPPQRLVLVEGDPSVAQALTQLTAGRAGVEVHQQAVSADGMPLDWHRYNLQALNGPLAATGLAAYYPRLRLLGQERLPSASLSALVDSLAIEASATELPHVLILDVPGQELALLDSLGAERLQRFTWVIVHGRNVHTGVGNTLKQAVDGLAASLHRPTQALSEPPRLLWSTSLLHFDRVQFEQQQLREALQHRDERLAGMAAAQQRLQTELHEVQQACQSLRQAEGAAQAQLATLMRERDALALGHQEKSVKAEALEVQNASLAKQLQDLHEQLSLLQQTAASDQALRGAQAAAEQALAQAAEEAAGLARTCERLQLLSQDQDSLLDRLRQELAATQQQRDEALAARGAADAEHLEVRQRLREELDAATHEQAQHAERLALLEQEHLALQTAHAGSLQSLAQVQAELESSRQIAAQTAATAAAELEALRKAHGEEAHWHRENANWAKHLKAENDRLAPELDRLRAEHETTKRALAEAQDRLASQRQQMDERDARQRLMDAEILRAEAQLALIKDVLIREKNF